MGFTEILTIIFIVLKLLGVITWAWWVCLLPEIIAGVLYVIVVVAQLQSELTKKMQNNPYGRTANFKREDGYKEGILAAKSILHNFYKWKGGTEE